MKKLSTMLMLSAALAAVACDDDQNAPEVISSENEVTSGTLVDNDTILVTHTVLKKTGDKVSACEGELLALSLKDADFGKVIKRIDVGPMPDAVGVSPNKKWAVTADERDGKDVWGKCTVDSALPSVTIVDLSNGAANMKAVARIQFTKNEKGPREPEYVAIASDNDTVAVTLQDSYEVAFFKISEVMAKSPNEKSGLIELSENDVKITSLPTKDSWPDGIVAFKAADGKEYFVAAGEWNDTLIALDIDGNIVSDFKIPTPAVPSSFPRVDDGESPYFSPDSVVSYTREDSVYVAATLRHAGAFIIYNYDDPTTPVHIRTVKVGESDNDPSDPNGSRVKPEGIGFASDIIWTANEKESSVSAFDLTSDTNQAVTIKVGTNDNAEIIRAIPNTKEAILISSKAQKISRLAFDGNIKVVKSADAVGEKSN